MTAGRGSFRPDELLGDGLEIPDAERAAAYAAARDLEQALSTEGIHPSVGFAERVMAAVALEPAPRSIGFLAPLLARHSLAGVLASVRAAWSVVIGGAGRPAGARGLAFAYVLAIMLLGASLTGVAALGTVGAIGLLNADGTPRPSLVVPGPSASPDGSQESSEPEGSDEPGDSAEPSGSPEASESNDPGESDHPEDSVAPGATSSPRATDDHGDGISSPQPSDDHGESSPAPSASDDHGGSGSDSPSQSPKPSETPKSSD